MPKYLKKDRWLPLGRQGVVAVEYAILVAGIAGTIMGALFVLGNDIEKVFPPPSDAIGERVEELRKGASGRE